LIEAGRKRIYTKAPSWQVNAMPHKKLLGVIVLGLLGGSVSISGCSNISYANEGGFYPAQIIIKFTKEISDPSGRDFVEQLSQDAGIALNYVRPMSNGAHVFKLGKPFDEKQLSNALQRLSDRKDVLYAEQNRIMRHQSKPP
jgi:hypothetical protein